MSTPPSVTEMPASCYRMSGLAWVLCLTFFLLTQAKELRVSPSGCEPLEGSASGIGEVGLQPILTTLDTALQMVESDTVLYLESGLHCIGSFVLLQGWQNISLIGESDNVVLTCKESLGLAFVNVTDLRLENFRITGCKLSLSGLSESVSLLKEFVDLFIEIPEGVRVALFLGHVQNLWMERVNITNTPGFGMVGINVMGESRVSNSIFSGNAHTDPECTYYRNLSLTTTVPGSQFGGGAYFLYQDYLPTLSTTPEQPSLEIDKTAFYDNSDCSIAIHISIGYKDSEAYQEIGYTIGGGGGLTVMLAQLGYGVDVTVSNTDMVNNIARFGSGAAIVVFAGVTNSHVLFKGNCTYISNGFSSLDFFTAVTNGTYASGGGALAVFLDATLPNLAQQTSPQQRNVSVQVVDGIFTENAAYVGGAVIVYSFFTSTANRPEDALQLRFTQCVFFKNAATLGTSIWVDELKSSARFQIGLQVELKDIIAVDNVGAQDNTRLTRRVQDNAAVIDVRAVNLTITGQCVYIANNSATAMQAVGSLIGVLGSTVVIERNTGVYGGGFNILQMSYLIIMPDSNLSVVNNTARIQGGAFYVNLLGSNPEIFNEGCFLYFGYRQFSACLNCSNFNDTNFHISVTGNSAQKGSTVYGSTLKSCPWARELYFNNYDGEVVFDVLSTQFPERFSFVPEPVTRQQVITSPERLEIGGQIETQEVYTVAPGESIDLLISAKDGFNQTISTVIAAYVVSSSAISGNNDTGAPATATATVGSDGFAVLGDKPTSTAFTLLSPLNQKATIGLYSVEALGAVQATFDVTVETCPLGFVFNRTGLSCACIHELLEEGIDCSVEQLLIIVPDGRWVGPVGENDDRLVIEDCIATYCVSGTKTIDVRREGYEVQCAEDSNRGGLLCGRCRTGYSTVLGSDRCLKCSNYTISLIVLFLLLGILLVVFISYFRITITGGFLNGALFYSNLVNLFEPVLTPVGAYDGRLALTSFLSLNLGVETCFYDTMDALQKIWWQLSFPLYLHIVMIAITLFARRCKWKREAGSSTIQAFVTLSILCYVSVVLSCVELLGAIEVRTVSGDTLTRWIVDPTVVYFEGAHGFLTFVAIVLLIVYIIPLPLLLLFPKQLYSIRYLKLFKPFYDAFWEPFKPQFRFWLGFRLMFRWIPLVMFYLVPFPTDAFVTALALLLLLYAQLMFQPFKSPWVNHLDNLFLLNLVVLFFGAVFFEADDAEEQLTAFSTFFVTLAYIGFAAILIYHIIIRYRTLREGVQKCFKRGEEKVVVTVLTSAPEPEALETQEGQEFVTIDTNITSDTTQTDRGSVVRVNFSVLREPLLEEGSLVLVPVSSPTEEAPTKTKLTPASKDDSKSKRKAKKSK